MRRTSTVLALIDEAMADLNRAGVDEQMVLSWSDDRTEVNLDLSGALESVEVEIRMASRRGPVDLRARPRSSVEDRLVEEEFVVFDDDLPMLDSYEFVEAPNVRDLVAAPPVHDLVPPGRGQSLGPQPVSIRTPAPRMWPVSKIALASVAEGAGRLKDGTEGADRSIQVMKEAIIAAHTKSAPDPKKSGLLWISAIALWAVTMLSAWALRMEIFELIGW